MGLNWKKGDPPLNDELNMKEVKDLKVSFIYCTHVNDIKVSY